MIISLENNHFTAEISSRGAELQKFIRKSDCRDIIWQGDNSVWGNHAPILFPFVARCLGGHFMIDGKKCEYTRNHGFVRELEWNCLEQKVDSAVFELSQSQDTLYRFPYDFSIKTEYALTEKGLDWKIIVKNTGNKVFRFGVGTHAAFSMNGKPAEDFIVEFEKKEPLATILCNLDGYLKADADGSVPVLQLYGEENPGLVPVTRAGFGNGHLFMNVSSNWVGFRNKKDDTVIKIQTKGFPYCMIWQNTVGKPQFVCIEPWYGLPDAENSDHLWQNKPALNELQPGKDFICEQNIWLE